MKTVNTIVRNPRIFLWIMIAIAAVGFFDALYLTIEHYRAVVPPCTVTHGCTTVLTSPYATIGPVPVALLGVLFYAAMFLVTLSSFWKMQWTVLVLILATLGFCATLVLVGIQLFVLRAICPYCMVSAGTSALLFGLSVFLQRARRILVTSA